MHAFDANDYLHLADLETISRLRSDQAPVFSLYLDLRDGAVPLERFEALLAAAEQQRKLDQDTEQYRNQWRQDADRIRAWLGHASQPNKSLAVLSSQGKGLWRAFALPAPVADRLVVTSQPFLRPLMILLAEFTCTLVIQLAPESARLSDVFLGQVREIDTLAAVPVSGDVQGNPFLRYVAERAQTAWQAQPYGRLLLAGSPPALEGLRALLPSDMDAQVVADTRLDPHASLEETLQRVQQVEFEHERAQEAQTVAELLELAGSEGAVLGLEQSLLAVRSKKVRLLLAAADYRKPGGECPSCGFLSDQALQPCLICGVALRPEADIIEVALKRVLDQGAQIDVLRSPEARQAIEPHGQIGALLQEDAASLPPRDVSNSQALISGGKVNTEAVLDEAVEESFPASDPPGNW